MPSLVVRARRTLGDARTAAHLLLRESAAALLAVPVAGIAVGHHPSGQPYLRGPDVSVYASVSHTRGLAAVAVSVLGPVGVDVEALRPLPALEMGQRYFTAEEYDWLGRQPDVRVVPAFLELWTAKESIGKLHGKGLRGGGLRRPVPLPGAPGCWQSVPDEPGVFLAHAQPPDGFIVAVAVGHQPMATATATPASCVMETVT